MSDQPSIAETGKDQDSITLHPVSYGGVVLLFDDTETIQMVLTRESYESFGGTEKY